MVDQSVNQADAILGEYARYAKRGSANRMPAQLAKALLNGVFSGTVAHLNETEHRALQIPPLGNLVNNEQTPWKCKSDMFLGKGNGIESRLASIKKLQSKAQTNFDETRNALQTYAPCILESVAGGCPPGRTRPPSRSCLKTAVFVVRQERFGGRVRPGGKPPARRWRSRKIVPFGHPLLSDLIETLLCVLRVL